MWCVAVVVLHLPLPPSRTDTTTQAAWHIFSGAEPVALTFAGCAPNLTVSFVLVSLRHLSFGTSELVPATGILVLNLALAL